MVPGPWTASHVAICPARSSPARLQQEDLVRAAATGGLDAQYEEPRMGNCCFYSVEFTEGLYLISNFQLMWELLKSWEKVVKNWKYVCTFSGRYWKGMLYTAFVT